MKLANLGCLMLMLACLIPAEARAQIDQRVLQAGKAATGLVLLDGDRGSGSCFCIDAEGYFVTNAHVVRSEVGASIIMNPNTDDQFVLDAKVVARDGESDLALLKADMGRHKVKALKLADSNKLNETDQLVAFGFPLGELLSFDSGEYPAVSVNVGRVTSLRKSGGELEAIQTDATVTFGNSGGPMLDKRGNVAGVVVAGLPGVDINFAIPTHKVDKLLKMPAVAVTLPEAIAYGKRFDPVPVKVEVKDIRGGGGGSFSVNVVVGSGDDAETVKAIGRGGSFVAGVHPAKKPKDAKPAAEEFEADLQLPSGAMTVKLKDVPLRVGKHRLRLSEVALVEKKGGAYRVIKTDGTELKGATLTGPTVTTEFEGERMRLPLSKATWIRVFHEGLEEGSGFTVPLTIEVMRGDEVVAQTRAALRVDDPAELYLPDAPGLDIPPINDPDGSGSDRPPAQVAKGDYRFDARRDRRLKGWDCSSETELPSSVKGIMDFTEMKRGFELTFQRKVLIESLTIEFETTPNKRGSEFKVSYGDNVYRVDDRGDWIGMSETRMTYRLDKQAETEIEGKIKFTIDFPAPGITRLSSGRAELHRNFLGPGELKLHIPNPDGIKLHRIGMSIRKPGADRSAVASASAYEPPEDAEPIAFDRQTVMLSGAFGSYDVGGAGRYMVFHVPEKKAIEVLDIVQGKIVHTMNNISDDVIIAAGLEHYVLVLPGQNLMQKWSFKTFEREKVGRLPGKGAAVQALLGENSTGPMLLCSEDALFIDMRTLRAIETAGETVGGSTRHIFRIDPSADGKVFGGIQTGGGPLPFQRMHLHDNQFTWVEKFSGTSNAVRYARPTADGRLLLTPLEGIFDVALNPISADWLKGMAFYPTCDPRFFLAVRFVETKKRDVYTTHVNICTTADRRIIHTEVGFPGMSPKGNHNSRSETSRRLLFGDKHFYYNPWAKALVTLGWDKKGLTIHKLDVVERLSSQGLDILFVQSAPPVYAPRAGKLAYQIDAVSSAEGLTYELLDGPQGVKVSETGLVTWDIPPISENKKETIILSVSNKAGEEVLHSFDLTYR